MFEWTLDRPLALLDIEATGDNPRRDRLIDLAIIKILPDKSRTPHDFRVNPQAEILPEVTAIHGITNDDVKDSPPFEDIAPTVMELLEGCDLGGYSILRYDIPMLEQEFLRAKLRFPMESRRVIDAQRIFHRREPRDLSAALRFYCNDEHTNAHGAMADTEATVRVLEGQLTMYPDLPSDIAALAEYCNPRDPSWADRSGRLKWVKNEITLNFGKHKGRVLRDLIANDPSFLKWILRSDFPLDTLQIVRDAMEDRYPDSPQNN